MPSLPTLLARADSAVGSWVTNSGGTTSLFLKVDEGIAGAVDTSDYIQAPNDSDASDYKCLITQTPATFNTIKSLSFNVRYSLSAAAAVSTPDIYGLSIRIMSGLTVLAAQASSGTFQTVVTSTTLNTTFANTGVLAFTYVNTAATKTQWDAAVVELRQTYTQSGTKDAHAMRVSTLEFTGTYNAILSVTAGVFTLTGRSAVLRQGHMLPAACGAFSVTGNAAVLRAVRKLAVSVGAFNVTGNATGLKAGRMLSVQPGVFTINSNSAGLSITRKLSVSQGAFTVTGRNAGVIAQRKLPAQTGVFVLTGNPLGPPGIPLAVSGFFMNFF